LVNPPASSWLGNIDRWGSICSIVAFVSTGFGFLRQMLPPAPSAPQFGGSDRLLTILLLGLMAAVAHGILWSLVERFCGWTFGAGGHGKLPEGWPAVVLSATMTIPLIVVPMAYQAFIRVPLVPPRHIAASAAILVTGALGHLLMYGSKWARFPGVRRRIMPLRERLTLPIALLLEVIWTCVHFVSIALVYRIVTASNRDVAHVILGPLLGAGVFFFGIVTFILLRYPGSLKDRTWIQVRGVLAGLILLVALEGGMLM
jgi:hypothetical protein